MRVPADYRSSAITEARIVTMDEQRTEPSNPGRIVIVDDHPIMRQGLVEIINRESDLEVRGEAQDAHQALRLIEDLKPDLILVDISLKGISGIDLIKDIKAHHPDLPALVVTMHEEPRYAERALRAGARGYITKREKGEKLIAAIRRVLSGEIYLDETMVPKLLSELAEGAGGQADTPSSLLSKRELEVFRLIGQGHDSHEIAERMRVNIKTIEVYRSSIKKKLKLRSAVELHQHAYRWAQTDSQI